MRTARPFMRRTLRVLGGLEDQGTHSVRSHDIPARGSGQPLTPGRDPASSPGERSRTIRGCQSRASGYHARRYGDPKPPPGPPPSTFPDSVSRTNPMRMTRTSRAGLGPASWALLALFHAGCQPGATPSDRPTPLPSLGVEAASNPPAATAPMAGPESSADNAAPAPRPIEALEQDVVKLD